MGDLGVTDVDRPPEYKIGDKVTVGGITFTKTSDYPFDPTTRDLIADYHCCALEDGHEGPCAYVCPECGGTTYCWACGGPSGDDLGTGCGECDGTGYCFHCYEGMVGDE